MQFKKTLFSINKKHDTRISPVKHYVYTAQSNSLMINGHRINISRLLFFYELPFATKQLANRK